MPIYEFLCRACDHRFELLETAAPARRPADVACPKCHASKVERQWSRITVGTARKGYHPAKPLDV